MEGEEILSQTQPAVENNIPETGLAGDQQGGEETPKNVSREEFENLQKRLEDNRAWNMKLSQENEQLKKAVQSIESKKAEETPAEYTGYDQDGLKVVRDISRKEAERIVKSQLEAITARQNEERLVEDFMNNNFPDHKQFDRAMQKEYLSMPEWQKATFRNDIPSRVALYHMAKSKYSGSASTGIVNTSGRPNIPADKRSVLSQEQKEMASALGMDMKKVEENAKMLAQRGGQI